MLGRMSHPLLVFLYVASCCIISMSIGVGFSSLFFIRFCMLGRMSHPLLVFLYVASRCIISMSIGVGFSSLFFIRFCMLGRISHPRYFVGVGFLI